VKFFEALSQIQLFRIISKVERGLQVVGEPERSVSDK